MVTPASCKSPTSIQATTIICPHSQTYHFTDKTIKFLQHLGFVKSDVSTCFAVMFCVESTAVPFAEYFLYLLAFPVLVFGGWPVKHNLVPAVSKIQSLILLPSNHVKRLTATPLYIRILFLPFLPLYIKIFLAQLTKTKLFTFWGFLVLTAEWFSSVCNNEICFFSIFLHLFELKVKDWSPKRVCNDRVWICVKEMDKSVKEI